MGRNAKLTEDKQFEDLKNARGYMEVIQRYNAPTPFEGTMWKACTRAGKQPQAWSRFVWSVTLQAYTECNRSINLRRFTKKLRLHNVVNRYIISPEARKQYFDPLTGSYLDVGQQGREAVWDPSV